jgi:hypothetical protein
MTKTGWIALASCLLLAAPAAASDERDRDRDGHDRDRPSKVLRLIERGTGSLAFLDLGDPGPSIGDRLVFANDLFDQHGRKVGTDGAECTIVRIDLSAPPAAQQIVQCVITVKLADGQLTFQSLAQGTENYFAITGGTGAYRKARGEAFVRDTIPLVEAEITIWLFQ